MNPKCFMLSERSQTQKAEHCMAPYLWHSRKGKGLGHRGDEYRGAARGGVQGGGKCVS